MTTLAAIKKQIMQLEKQAAEVRKAEVAKAVAAIKKLIVDNELTADDLAFIRTAGTRKAAGARSARGKAKVRATGRVRGKSAPKYRDPKTGKTWTGVGKAPAWIVPATKKGRRDDYLIEATSVPVVAKSPAKRAAKASPKKRSAPRISKRATVKTKTAKVAAKPKIPLASVKTKPAVKRAIAKKPTGKAAKTNSGSAPTPTAPAVSAPT